MLNNHQEIDIIRLIKKIILFIFLINLLFVLLSFTLYGKISLYNLLFPGRERMPFGENPEKSYNLTLNNLDAMISSHKIARDHKNENEYRIVVIGDSSIWGFLQIPEETLTGILSSQIDFTCNDKKIEIFNLGYPSLSVLKDLMIIDKLKTSQPDLILWFITLESLNKDDQLSTPLVENNAILLNKIINDYDLNLEPAKFSFWNRTLIAQRRNIADMIRLQFYGIMWAATGIDQEYPDSYTRAQRDFESDSNYKGYLNKELDADNFALPIIEHAIDKNPFIDFILINEPILISEGENSEIRYNFYYPRWAYDEYREIINDYSNQNKIKYYDLWNLVPEENFTNSAIHLDYEGEKILSNHVIEILEEYCGN